MMDMQSSSMTTAVGQFGGAASFPKLVNMWRTGRGCDVTIVCKNDENIKAHSLVLCSVSDKLDELLLLSADKMISSPDVEVSTWKQLLEIIYTGTLFLTGSSDTNIIEKSIALAQSLGMDNIVEEYNKLSVVNLMKESNISLVGEKGIEDADVSGDNHTVERQIFDVINTTSSCKTEVEDPLSHTKTIPLKEFDEPYVRKSVCYGCHSRCSAEKVKCILCFKVVENDINHMETAHPFTPKTSDWVFTCRYLISENNSRNWMVCKKIPGKLIGSNGEEVTVNKFHCCLCETYFVSLKEVVKHVKVVHDVTARLCRICEAGFETGLQCRDHEHFCNGGELMSCPDCGKKLGGFHTLSSHQAIHRKEWDSTDCVEEQQNMEGYEINGELLKKKSQTSELDQDDTSEIFSKFGDSAQKKTTSARKRRKENCIKCGSRCRADRVRCLYCSSVVPKNSSHMDEYHPFTPSSSLWVYNCKYIPTEVIDEKFVICAKELNDDQIYQYRCYKCEETFEKLDTVETHLRKEHNIMARICDVCEMGFIKEYHYKDHAHFCGGGQLLFCKICSKKLGGLKQLKDHMKKIHDKENWSEDEQEALAEGTSDANSIINSFINISHDLKHDRLQENNVTNTEQVMIQNESLFCSECNLYFSSHSSFATHNSMEHDDSISYCKEIAISMGRRSSRRRTTVNSKYKDYVTDFNLSKVKTEKASESELSEENDESNSKSIDYKVLLADFQDKKLVKGETETSKVNLNCKKEDYLEPNAISEVMRLPDTTVPSIDQVSSVLAAEDSETNNDKVSGQQTSQILTESPVVMRSKTVKRKRKHISNIKTSNGVCTECNGPCHAPEVRCYYCFDVVNNDASHKVRCHPFSGKGSLWLFSCKLEIEKYKAMKHPVIFVKENHHKKVSSTERDPRDDNLYQYKCLKCDSEFTTVEDLQKHVSLKFKCHLCQLFFVKLTSLQRHVGRNHNIDCFTCSECETGYSNYDCLEEHEHFCKGGQILICDHCDEEFCSVLKLKEHCQSFHQEKENTNDLPLQQEGNEGMDHVSPRKKLKTRDKQEVAEKLSIKKALQDIDEHLTENPEDLDDEERDPDYVTEAEELEEQEEDEKEDDEDVSDYEPPVILSNIKSEQTVPIKRKRGRPRKDKSEKMSSTKPEKSGPPTEEELCEIHKDKFNAVSSKREWVHVKMCYTCGDSCSAETVKCGYCGMVIVVADKFNHMQEMHPLTPPTSVWPVNCRYFKLNIQIPEVVSKQVVEQEFVKDDEGNLTQYTRGKGVYVCTVCEEKCGSLSKTEEHLFEKHNVKGIFCKQCGLCLKSSCSSLIVDHQHFCYGGDLLSCVDCGKFVGSWKNADNHRRKYHSVSFKKKRKCNKPLYKSFMTKTEGKYGYTILCADCNGTCKNAPVKCTLCQEIVVKDDIHMKLKHPYSPCKTWIVFCRYAVHAGTISGNPLVSYIGEKVPTVSQEDLLNEGVIPSKHPFHYKCNHCQMYFLQRKYLKLHVKKEHIEVFEKNMKGSSGLFNFSCKSCEALLYGRSYFFQDHSHFCSQGELHRCEICDERFCGLQKLNQHHKIKHNKVYSDKQKLRKKSLRVSNSVVELPEGTELHCTECPFTTQLIKSMKDHNRNVHGWRGLQLTQFCRFCFQVFKVRSDRERHEQNQHLDGQRALCEICGEDFEIPLQLERHDYYVHRGGREYVSLKQKRERLNATAKICPFCPKEYSSKAKLNRHIKVVHEQSLVIKCDICGKTFCSQSSLKIHMDRHAGNRSCQCPYCPYTDFRGYMINNHVQMEHPGMEKPYKRNLVFQNKEQGQEVNYDQSEVIYETGEVIFQVPNQQIEVKQVEMEQTVEEAVAAGNVLLEYYVVQ